MSRLTFITGIGRSGSSWFGKFLASSLKCSYFQEPFGKLKNKTFHDRFTGVMLNDDDDRGIWDFIQKKFMRKEENIVIKDFIIRFAAEYLKDQGARVIIIVRHPYPVIKSTLRLAQTSDISPLIEKGFVQKNFPELEEHILKHTDNPFDLLAMRYGILYKYFVIKAKFDFVKHEDLCIYPEKVLPQIGFEFNDSAKNYYYKHNQFTKGPYKTFRRTLMEAYKWHRDFDTQELLHLYEILKPFKILYPLGYLDDFTPKCI